VHLTQLAVIEIGLIYFWIKDWCCGSRYHTCA